MDQPAPKQHPHALPILAHIHAVGRDGIMPDASRLAQLSRVGASVDELSGAELYAQLTPTLCSRHPHIALQLMHECGVLERVLPELDATVNFSQEAGRRHKDVWAHTKTVVWQAVPQPAVRWAAALHDIGKVPTRQFLASGGVTFHGHAELGERMFLRGAARRLSFPAQVESRVAELIRWHQRPGHYEPNWSDGAVRRFAREVGPGLDELLNLSRADITSKRPGRRKHCLRSISALAKRIRELEREDRRPKHLPSGLGRELIAVFELRPGPEIGVLRARLTQMCESGEIEGGRAPAYYIEQVRLGGLLS